VALQTHRSTNFLEKRRFRSIVADDACIRYGRERHLVTAAQTPGA
jgi:hypothetical protein